MSDRIMAMMGVDILESKISDGNMSLKWGEEEEVKTNREIFYKVNDLNSRKLVIMSILDTDIVTTVGNESAGKTVETDAMITKEQKIHLGLITADCLPITFYDPKNKVIGLAHCGWKSTHAKLVQKVIDQLVTLGTNPGDLLVNIGSGVRPESYLFDTEIVVQKQWPEWQPFLKEVGNGMTSVNTVGFNIRQMEELGVLRKNILVSPIDTISDPNYFSHYRAVRSGEKEGRFMTVVRFTNG